VAEELSLPNIVRHQFLGLHAGAVACLMVLTTGAKADPSMWVIRDKDSTIYMIGTVHLLRHQDAWKPEKAQKAVRESTELWLEVADADNQAAVVPLIQQYGIDREKSLFSKLNPAQRETLAKLAANYNMPLSSLEPMKPWLAGLMLAVLPLQKAGYDPNAGVDRLLKGQAEKEGDKIFGFETMEEQIRFFAELPEREQIAFLDQTLEDVAEGLALLDKIAKAWLNGDMNTIGDILVNELKAEAPKLYEDFLVRRNTRWSEKIHEILNRAGVQQIAVGAGHLAGPDSLQVQLAKRGIKVEPY
jgi:uncharacterized protein YbaP (TraB family)